MDVNARPVDLKLEVEKVRKRYDDITYWSTEDFDTNRHNVGLAVDAIVNKIQRINAR